MKFDIARRLVAARHPEAPGAYELELVAWSPPFVRTTSGLPIHVPSDARALSGPLDTLIVPGGLGTFHHGAQPELRCWLRAMAAVTRRVASVCTGSVAAGVRGPGRRAPRHLALGVVRRARALLPQRGGGSVLLLGVGHVHIGANAMGDADSAMLIAKDPDNALQVLRHAQSLMAEAE